MKTSAFVHPSRVLTPGGMPSPYNGKIDLQDTEQLSVGITLRAHFAGLAMQSLAERNVGVGDIAQKAVALADALIAELDK